MKLNRRFSAAKTRYKKDGAKTLSKNVLRFAYRETARSIIKGRRGPRYHDLLIGSSELRTRAHDRLWELEDSCEHLSKEWIRGIVPLQDNQSCRFHNAPWYLFKDPFVAEIEDVTVVGPRLTAMTSDGKFVADTFTFDPFGEAFENKKGRKAIDPTIDQLTAHVFGAIFGLPMLSSHQSLSTAAILEWKSHNYYHWVLEQFPKLRGIERYQNATGEEVTIILPADPPPYIHEFLSRMDFNSYLCWNGEPLHVDQLVVPSFPEITPGAVGWTRDTLLDTVDNWDTETPEWVYVSRQNANNRRIANFEAVRNILKKHGVTIIAPETLSLDEEIKIFNGADGVIGPHGAGLTAITWGDDLTVLEIFNEVVNAPFYILSNVMGHEYHALSGDAVGGGRDIHRKINLDAGQLDAMLAEFI